MMFGSNWIAISRLIGTRAKVMNTRRLGVLGVLLLLEATVSATRADVTYTYDALGRVSSITYDDGKRVTYNYDPAGNRTSHAVENTASPTNNLPPVAANDSFVTDQTTSYTKSFDPRTNDTDPNNDALVITAKTNGSLGSVAIGGDGTSLTYTFTGTPPSAGNSVSDSFSYTISDGNGGTSSATVTATISNTSSPPNSPPVATNDTIAVDDSTTYIRTFDPRTNDSDPNGDLLTVSGKTNGAQGVVAIGPGGASITYTFTATPPAAGASTNDSFTYTISDGRGGTSTATVNVTVSTVSGGGGGGGGIEN